MKLIKSIFFMSIIGMMMFTSCTTEMENKPVEENSTIKVLPNKLNNETVEFKLNFKDGSPDFDNPIFINNENKKGPITLPYWHCGSGVYTNGTNTYQMLIADDGAAGAYIMVDTFSQTVFWYTTQWCECTCERRDSNRDENVFHFTEDEQLEFRFIFENEGTKFEDSKIESYNISTSATERFWPCGGGVYTNGKGKTFMIILVEDGFPGSQTFYAPYGLYHITFTQHWCSCTCPDQNIYTS